MLSHISSCFNFNVTANNLSYEITIEITFLPDSHANENGMIGEQRLRRQNTSTQKRAAQSSPNTYTQKKWQKCVNWLKSVLRRGKGRLELRRFPDEPPCKAPMMQRQML